MLAKGESAIINNPVKIGHTFNEWTLQGVDSSYNNETNEFIMGIGNATLTANWTITGNGLTEVGDRLIYKGNNPSNYLKFAGDTDLYRIISFENDGTMKIVNMTYSYNIPYDISANRNKTNSPYCIDSEVEAETGIFKGCNAWSSGTSWLGKTDGTDDVGVDSSVLEYLRDTYYESILAPNIKSKVKFHDFNVGLIGQNIDIVTVNTQAAARKWQGFIGLIGVDEVMNASTSDCTNLGTSSTICNNYLTGATSSTKSIWTINGATINTWDIWSILSGTTVSIRRASRYNHSSLVFYAHPAFYINSNYLFTGSGTLESPFVIE